MLDIALTGGIGSGKSTVARALVRRGATLIDADRVVRDLQAPGSPLLDRMAELLGADIILADGSLDRSTTAGRVFGEPELLARLNEIVHPAVREEMARRREALGEGDGVVVFDIPLLAEGDRRDWDGVVVVDVDPRIAVERLVRHRGFTEADARARIANQASRDERRAIAGYVIDNSGDLDALEDEIDRCWEWIGTLRTPAGR